MALSIKNQETERLARELARATGETVTTAVTAALVARLDAVRAEGSAREERRTHLQRIVDDAAARWGVDDGDPADHLYDELGLPR
ncbi:type II toxin-antitoxin system VapB family antitoxin [uncultured Pseudokineococcus sp.]|uniref:type II toxin-antitoxin system VapB family antitoxin n=1 Tax=uncultured Pseudokineococcus sp. TaxID=1642928 RepID=UPI0026281B8C|nr:type II toxin-antitoxin system VapB family antitoxin [uncultured Pseudokineococcus sp.]